MIRYKIFISCFEPINIPAAKRSTNLKAGMFLNWFNRITPFIIWYRWQCCPHMVLLLYLATWCFSGDKAACGMNLITLCLTLLSGVLPDSLKITISHKKKTPKLQEYKILNPCLQSGKHISCIFISILLFYVGIYFERLVRQNNHFQRVIQSLFIHL